MTKLSKLANQIQPPNGYFAELSTNEDEISFTNPQQNLFINLMIDHFNADQLTLTDDGSVFEDFYPLQYIDLTPSQKILINHYLKTYDLNILSGLNEIIKDTSIKTVQVDVIQFSHQLHLIQKSLTRFTNSQ